MKSVSYGAYPFDFWRIFEGFFGDYLKMRTVLPRKKKKIISLVCTYLSKCEFGVIDKVVVLNLNSKIIGVIYCSAFNVD